MSARRHNLHANQSRGKPRPRCAGLMELEHQADRKCRKCPMAACLARSRSLIAAVSYLLGTFWFYGFGFLRPETLMRTPTSHTPVTTITAAMTEFATHAREVDASM